MAVSGWQAGLFTLSRHHSRIALAYSAQGVDRPAAELAGAEGVPAARTKGAHAAKAGSVCIEQCDGLPLCEDLTTENGGETLTMR